MLKTKMNSVTTNKVMAKSDFDIDVSSSSEEHPGAGKPNVGKIIPLVLGMTVKPAELILLYQAVHRGQKSGKRMRYMPIRDIGAIPDVQRLAYIMRQRHAEFLADVPSVSIEKMLRIIQEVRKGTNKEQAIKKVDLEYEINPEQDLNKVSQKELDRKKAIMDESFIKTQIRPGDAGFVWDKRVEYTGPKELTSWDDDTTSASAVEDEAAVPVAAFAKDPLKPKNEVIAEKYKTIERDNAKTDLSESPFDTDESENEELGIEEEIEPVYTQNEVSDEEENEPKATNFNISDANEVDNEISKKLIDALSGIDSCSNESIGNPPAQTHSVSKINIETTLESQKNSKKLADSSSRKSAVEKICLKSKPELDDESSDATQSSFMDIHIQTSEEETSSKPVPGKKQVDSNPNIQTKPTKKPGFVTRFKNSGSKYGSDPESDEESPRIVKSSSFVPNANPKKLFLPWMSSGSATDANKVKKTAPESETGLTKEMSKVPHFNNGVLGTQIGTFSANFGQSSFESEHTLLSKSKFEADDSSIKRADDFKPSKPDFGFNERSSEEEKSDSVDIHTNTQTTDTSDDRKCVAAKRVQLFHEKRRNKNSNLFNFKSDFEPIESATEVDEESSCVSQQSDLILDKPTKTPAVSKIAEKKPLPFWASHQTELSKLIYPRKEPESETESKSELDDQPSSPKEKDTMDRTQLDESDTENSNKSHLKVNSQLENESEILDNESAGEEHSESIDNHGQTSENAAHMPSIRNIPVSISEANETETEYSKDFESDYDSSDFEAEEREKSVNLLAAAGIFMDISDGKEANPKPATQKQLLELDKTNQNEPAGNGTTNKRIFELDFDDSEPLTDPDFEEESVPDMSELEQLEIGAKNPEPKPDNQREENPRSDGTKLSPEKLKIEGEAAFENEPGNNKMTAVEFKPFESGDNANCDLLDDDDFFW